MDLFQSQKSDIYTLENSSTILQYRRRDYTLLPIQQLITLPSKCSISSVNSLSVIIRLVLQSRNKKSLISLVTSPPESRMIFCKI